MIDVWSSEKKKRITQSLGSLQLHRLQSVNTHFHIHVIRISDLIDLWVF